MFRQLEPRPTPLRNGNCCYSDEVIAAIDRKPVDELNASDFEVIFTVTGCTLSSEQERWFLPHAFAYLRREPEAVIELLGPLLYFIADRDSESGLDDETIGACREAIASLFRDWTREFRVVHYDLAKCRASGSGLPYIDWVAASEEAVHVLNELCRYIAYIPLAEEFFASFSRDGRSDSEAAWYLELSRELLRRFGYFENTPSMTAAKRSKRIVELVNDSARLRAAYAQIASTIVAGESSPTYWRDVRTFFGLE